MGGIDTLVLRITICSDVVYVTVPLMKQYLALVGLAR